MGSKKPFSICHLPFAIFHSKGEKHMRWVISALWSLVLISSLALIVSNGLLVGEASQSVRNRIVRVVTVSQAGLDRDRNDLLEPTMARLNQAASFHPDIACLPEVFSNRPPEPVSGPVTQRLVAWAREHACYLIFGLKTKKANKVYNSAILIDRKGQIVGQYDKMHPTEGEIQEGITPGDNVSLPLFKTDFGTIGVQICFDVNWRDQWHRLKQRGAQIIFWPSAYPASRQLQALALSNEYYIVSSTMDRPAQIYDISGDVLASSGKYQEWAGAALPLGKRLFEIDYNAEKVQQIQQKYGPKVQINWFHDSDWFTLASLDPNLTVEDLSAEYGLVPLEEYLARCSKVIDRARTKAMGK
jgi:beta-ureidopropionase